MSKRRPALMRVVAGMLLLPVLSACMSWRAHEVRPEQVILENRPRMVRITLADSSQVLVRDPRVSGSVLVGTDLSELIPLNFPLDLIARLETQEIEAGKTVLAAVAIGGALVLFAGTLRSLSGG